MYCNSCLVIISVTNVYSYRSIMSEYNDCLMRAQRLASAREAFLAKSNSAVYDIRLDDLYIYLRYLVCHLHSLKRFNQYLKVRASSKKSRFVGIFQTDKFFNQKTPSGGLNPLNSPPPPDQPLSFPIFSGPGVAACNPQDGD